ncbi:MAG: PEGA domain-containing protein [Kofleriaceae bacterium]
MGLSRSSLGRAALVVACAWHVAAADEPPPDPAPDAPPAMDEAEARATARRLLDGGDGFLKKGDQYARRKKTADAAEQYQRALDAYRKAFELLPNPQILFPIAVAEERLELWPEAARDFRRFMVGVPDLDEKLKADATAHFEAAKLHVGVLTLVIEPEATQVTLNGDVIGTSPLPDPLFLPAGDYTLGMTADGFQPLEETVTVEVGSESERTFQLPAIEVKVVLPPPPRPRPPPVEIPPAPSRVPLYLGGALTVGLVGGATAAGLIAVGKHGTFVDTGASAATREDARVAGRKTALIADGLIVGSVVAAGVFTFYYYKVYRPKARLRSERLRQQRQQDAEFDDLAGVPKVMVSPWVQAGGGGLVITGAL